MPAWFDLSTFDNLADSRYDDEPGLLTSVSSIDSLIQSEIDSGIPPEKIVVGGFSQGGAVACLLGLTTPRKLAGVACLSTWVVLNHKIESMIQPGAKELPVFWGHGKEDQVVHYECESRSLNVSAQIPLPHLLQPSFPFPNCSGREEGNPALIRPVGARSIELLTKKLGFPLVPSGTTFARPGLRFESYPGMAHSSSPKEVEDLKGWLAAALK
jgi:lysophospholipase-2